MEQAILSADQIAFWTLVTQGLGVLFSALLAGAAIYIAWKTAYGDRPIALHAYTRFELADEDVILTLEFWNMQKYPVVLTGGAVTLNDWDVIQKEAPAEGYPDWVQTGRTQHYFGDRKKINPSKSLTFLITFRAKPLKTSKADPELRWRFQYYDPSRRKAVTINGRAEVPGRHVMMSYEAKWPD